MRRIEFTKDETARIIKLYVEDLYGMALIGEEFGISKRAIQRILLDNNINITQNGRKFTGGKSAADKRYRVKHVEEINSRVNQWHKDHRDDRRKYHQEWRDKNREHVREYAREAEKQHYRSDPTYRLTKNMRYGVWACLKEREADKVLRTFQMLPYTVEQLKSHLESKFQPDMTWDNYGDWHVDHKRPISNFNFSSHKDPDFRECWSLDNLQPLWGEENWSKGARLI